MKNAKELSDFYLQRSVMYAQAAPEVMPHYSELIGAAIQNAAPLEPWQIQLILICIAVTHSHEPGVYVHMAQYIAAGGTREALISGLNAAVLACGGLAWSYTALAVEAYDQLTAEE